MVSGEDASELFAREFHEFSFENVEVQASDVGGDLRATVAVAAIPFGVAYDFREYQRDVGDAFSCGDDGSVFFRLMSVHDFYFFEGYKSA